MSENTIVVSNPNARVGKVRQLVAPLRPRRQGHPREVAARLIRLQDRPRETVVAVRELEYGQSYRDWFFSTATEGVLGQYFEEWISNDTETKWHLCNACLHLFRQVSRHDALEEILAIHCEPREVGESFKERLKRGPHVHLKPAGYPLSKAHFPLNFGHLNGILASMDTLTLVLQDAVQIAFNEVVDADWVGADSKE